MIPYIDLHCDTLTEVSKMNREFSLEEQPTLQVDLRRLREADVMAQFFAVWMSDVELEWSDWTHIERLVSILQGSLSEDFRLALSVEEIEKHAEEGALSAVLSLEDCRVVESIDDLEKLYAMGFRSYGLSWNYANSLGFPNSRDRDVMQRGLTKLGKEAVEWLNASGALVDVSHLSDGGFWDIAQMAKKPFVATHSNARALTDHPRNLTDEMIRAIAQSGGVAGINFCPAFLSEKSERNFLEDHVAHLNHMKNVGGEDFVAIGSDFDGVSGELAIDSPLAMQKLFDALEKEGWSERQIQKLARDNVLRVLREVW